MEIERVNENTVKFYITYVDIEERGFSRDEIWQDRERSEQLFWEMMDEARDQDDFFADGPLWIQVQALEKGIEVVVTRAQLSKDGQKLELPLLDKIIDIPLDENLEALFDQQLEEEDFSYVSKEGILEFLVKFASFEDVIALSHRMELVDVKNELYVFDERYYLYVEFDEMLHDEEEMDTILSMILEYGEESAMTVHRVQEYGKQIVAEQALDTIRQHFPPLS
ncbi:adaptor protein MecA [Ectobacillus sp. JY-23]|uniref:adaptor protein MecA n=1 Tax=Ectobacillus sp. JY-23 TaxID=2933872 RepID=UPI001FF647E1|nr:adaptor protein MecA [Ectobacillus sp. JY-23]UOY92146.1 adaptor protein MecA [Ectobacillus sp. JY-23]